MIYVASTLLWLRGIAEIDLDVSGHRRITCDRCILCLYPRSADLLSARGNLASILDQANRSAQSLLGLAEPPSTVSRELKRNGGQESYRATRGGQGRLGSGTSS